MAIGHFNSWEALGLEKIPVYFPVRIQSSAQFAMTLTPGSLRVSFFLALPVVVSVSGSPRSFPGRKAGQRQLEDEKRKNAGYRMAVKGAIRSNGTVRNDGFFGGVNRIGVTGRKVGTQEGRIGCISNKRPKLLIRPLIFVLYAVKEVEWGGSSPAMRSGTSNGYDS